MVADSGWSWLYFRLKSHQYVVGWTCCPLFSHPLLQGNQTICFDKGLIKNCLSCVSVSLCASDSFSLSTIEVVTLHFLLLTERNGLEIETNSKQ